MYQILVEENLTQNNNDHRTNNKEGLLKPALLRQKKTSHLPSHHRQKRKTSKPTNTFTKAEYTK